jgi:hypothetical protein
MENQGIDYKKLISDICEILQVDESNVVDAVKQYAQATKRPVMAAMIMIDPLLSEPRVSFIKNIGEVAFSEAEYSLSVAMDFVKALKAQEVVKQQSKKESDVALGAKE